MKTPTPIQVERKAAELRHLLTRHEAIEARTREGSVTATKGNQWTYVGEWGAKVHRHISKHGDGDRLLILAAHMEIYSMNFGGVVIVTNQMEEEAG